MEGVWLTVQNGGCWIKSEAWRVGVRGGQKFVEGCNLILLVTEGHMQNFKTLVQPLLGEFGWGSSCCSSCYHGKTKSTPRFGLGWEFDNNSFLVYLTSMENEWNTTNTFIKKCFYHRILKFQNSVWILHQFITNIKLYWQTDQAEIDKPGQIKLIYHYIF